jgi:hypothetical protein
MIQFLLRFGNRVEDNKEGHGVARRALPAIFRLALKIFPVLTLLIGLNSAKQVVVINSPGSMLDVSSSAA